MSKDMFNRMKEFISWFIQADIQFIDGDVVDYRTSCHAGDMPDDQISICRMEDREYWDPEYILDSSTVKDVKIMSSQALVTMSDDVILKFERAHKEKPADPELRCINEECPGHDPEEEGMFSTHLTVDKHGELSEEGLAFRISGAEFTCCFCESSAEWIDI